MKILFYLIAILPIIFYSCSTPAYVSNTPHTPMFKNSNELKVGASYGLPNTEAKASYSLTDHFFFFGGAAFPKKDSALKVSRRLFEIGIGYYNYFDKPLHIPFIIKINHIEFLAGYGAGYSFGTFNEIDSFPVNIPADFRRYYFQINTGLSNEKFSDIFNLNVNVAFGQSIRISYVNFFRFYYNEKTINKHSENLFFEYFLFSKFGSDLLRFELTTGFIGPLRKHADSKSFLFLIISLGASLNFNL